MKKSSQDILENNPIHGRILYGSETTLVWVNNNINKKIICKWIIPLNKLQSLYSKEKQKCFSHFPSHNYLRLPSQPSLSLYDWLCCLMLQTLSSSVLLIQLDATELSVPFQQPIQTVTAQSQNSRTTKWAKKCFAKEEINLPITAAHLIRAQCHLSEARRKRSAGAITVVVKS